MRIIKIIDITERICPITRSVRDGEVSFFQMRRPVGFMEGVGTVVAKGMDVEKNIISKGAEETERRLSTAAAVARSRRHVGF